MLSFAQGEALEKEALRVRRAQLLAEHQCCSLLRQFAAENTSDVEQRATATHYADVIPAIADYIALGTQDGIFERNSIEPPGNVAGKTHLQTFLLNSIFEHVPSLLIISSWAQKTCNLRISIP